MKAVGEEVEVEVASGTACDVPFGAEEFKYPPTSEAMEGTGPLTAAQAASDEDMRALVCLDTLAL